MFFQGFGLVPQILMGFRRGGGGGGGGGGSGRLASVDPADRILITSVGVSLAR